MPIPDRILDLLRVHESCFRHYSHPSERTASRTADRLYIREEDFAKCVAVMADGRPVVAVVPASERLDLKALSELLEARSVRLATERELCETFGDCEAGAVPPFGSLYGAPVVLDYSFDDRPSLSFKAGTHTDILQLSLDDFRKAVRPRVGKLTAPSRGRTPKSFSRQALAKRRPG